METNSERTELSHPAPSTLTCHQQHWLEVEPLGVSAFPVLSDHFTTSGLPLAERNVLLNEVSSPDTDSVSRACHAFLLAFCNGCQSHLDTRQLCLLQVLHPMCVFLLSSQQGKEV